MDSYSQLPPNFLDILEKWCIPLTAPAFILPPSLRPNSDPKLWPSPLIHTLQALACLTENNKERAWRLLESYSTARIREAGAKGRRSFASDERVQVEDVRKAWESMNKMWPGMQMQEQLRRGGNEQHIIQSRIQREDSLFTLPEEMEISANTQYAAVKNADIDDTLATELQNLRHNSVFSFRKDNEKPAQPLLQAQAETCTSPSLDFLEEDSAFSPQATSTYSPLAPISIFSFDEFSDSPLTPTAYTEPLEQLPIDPRLALPPLVTENLLLCEESGIAHSSSTDALRMELERKKQDFQAAEKEYLIAMERLRGV